MSLALTLAPLVIISWAHPRKSEATNKDKKLKIQIFVVL
jgi:hypothetical protein